MGCVYVSVSLPALSGAIRQLVTKATTEIPTNDSKYTGDNAKGARRRMEGRGQWRTPHNMAAWQPF